MEKFIYNEPDFSELFSLQKKGVQIVCPKCGAELVIALDADAANRLKVHPGIYCPVDRQHVCEIVELGSVRRNLWRNIAQKNEDK